MSSIEISNVRRFDMVRVVGRPEHDGAYKILFEGTVTDKRTMTIDVGDYHGFTQVLVHNPGMRLVPFQCSFITQKHNVEQVKVDRVYTTEEQKMLVIKPDKFIIEEDRMTGNIYSISTKTVTMHGSITSAQQYMLVIASASGGHGPDTHDLFIGDYDELLYKALDTLIDEYRDVIMFVKMVQIEYASHVDDWKEYKRLKMKFEGTNSGSLRMSTTSDERLVT